MATPAAAAPTRADAEVMSLVGLAHATSHFCQLLLPSLFPWLMKEFGLSFTSAGSLMTAFFVASGVGQALAGFAVDRLGATRVLGTGIALFALAALTLAGAHGYPMLLAAALTAGLANSVFHPADFTVLNRHVSLKRLGHAFSVHGLSGNLGWAAAPLFVTGIAAAAGWRAAALAATAVPLASLALLVVRRAALAGVGAAVPREAAGGPRPASPFAFLAVWGVWSCFLFFLLTTMAFGAIQNFAPAVLRSVYGLSLGGAASALSAYLLGGAAGIALGGFLAARSEAHERVVAVMLCSAALLALVLASGVIPPWSVGAFFAVIGFSTGMANPSRDLLVRKAATARFGQGSFGRVYGFVYSGLDLGLAVAPLLFGRLMDRGRFTTVLASVALLQGLAVLTALRGVARGAAKGGAPLPAA
jgi:FSR family fosmidomycin resistance protein-like MFS transporter